MRSHPVHNHAIGVGSRHAPLPTEPDLHSPDPRRLALIGFGEAGRILGGAWAQSGAFDVVAYDILVDASDTRDALRAQAQERGVAMAASSHEAVTGAAIVVSAVTATASRDVVRAAAPHLACGALFMDINSVSPYTKRASARDIGRAAADYVDAAVMAPVPPHGIAVPILLGGARAEALASRLRPVGMNVEVVSPDVGYASAIKMCRSVMVKGIEALALECLLAARSYGVEDRVLASLDETFPGLLSGTRADYLVSRIVVHGRRRAAEMREVAATLTEGGVPPRLALATSQHEDWIADLVRDGAIPAGDRRFAWRVMADAIAAVTDADADAAVPAPAPAP